MYIDNEDFEKWMQKLSKKLNDIGADLKSLINTKEVFDPFFLLVYILFWIIVLCLLLFSLLFSVRHVPGKVPGVLFPYIPEGL
jgi:hypothetical protein